MKQPREKNGRFTNKTMWSWLKWICRKLGRCK